MTLYTIKRAGLLKKLQLGATGRGGGAWCPICCFFQAAGRLSEAKCVLGTYSGNLPFVFSIRQPEIYAGFWGTLGPKGALYEAHEAPNLFPGPGHFPVPFHHGGGFGCGGLPGPPPQLWGEPAAPVAAAPPRGRYTLEVDLLGVEASLDATAWAGHGISCWISSACPTADHGRQKAPLRALWAVGGVLPLWLGERDLRLACALLDGGCGGVVLGGAGLFDRGPGSAVELPPQGEAALFLALPAPGPVPGGGEKQAPAVKIFSGDSA